MQFFFLDFLGDKILIVLPINFLPPPASPAGFFLSESMSDMVLLLLLVTTFSLAMLLYYKCSGASMGALHEHPKVRTSRRAPSAICSCCGATTLFFVRILRTATLVRLAANGCFLLLL